MSDIHSLSARYDVIVVGGRVAGAATAMLLARAGMSVLVVDRQSYGSDTLSTHALMRPAVMQLARWGLLDRLLASGAPLVTTTTFHYGDRVVPIAIRAEPGIPGLIAPRRTVLDRSLVDAAREAGATVVHDVPVRGLALDGSGRVCGAILRDMEGRERAVTAGYVVGADGLGSMVAREAGAAVRQRGCASVAHVFSYAAVPHLSGYHWYFAPGLAGALIPTNDDQSCVVVSVPSSLYDTQYRSDLAASRLASLEKLAPDVAAHVVRPGLIRAFRGTPGLLRQACGPGWLLVGDAGFYRDPLTSHGISDALRDAEGAANALLADTEVAMKRFEAERDSFARPILATTDAVSDFDWSLDELPERHKRFSDAMKAESALLSARSACDRIAPLTVRERPAFSGTSRPAAVRA